MGHSPLLGALLGTVLDGDPAPFSPKKWCIPQFSVHVCYSQTAVWIKTLTTWYRGRPWFTRHSVRWGTLSPLTGHSHPQFSANVRCGQTAGCTKMPLGIEVGLGPGDIVFDGDPAARKKAHPPPPNFRPMSIVAKRLNVSR